MRSITDTLGRVVNLNYDANLNLTTITQNWKDNNGSGSNVTHTYATFTYANQAINTNFGTNINTIYGPQGATTKVLQSIQFADGASTKFDYNAYGQVYKTSSFASDSHELNHTQVNLTDGELSAAYPLGQPDCPRFSQTKNYAENFNNNQETVTTNSYQENQTLTGINEPVTLVSVTTPDGVIEHSYSLGRTDWTEALPFYSETCTSINCTGTDKKRWIWTTWAQDNQTAPYLLNSRQTEVVVSDSVSSRKTQIDYYTQSPTSSVALYGLVKEVRSYDTNQNVLLKKATTEYNLDAAYTSRRIIGLPSKTETFGLNQANSQFEQTSKTTYAYDEGDFSDATSNQNLSSSIQHDNTNYGESFVIGRGNLTSTIRWDVLGQTASVTSNIRYNTAGAPVAQITPGSTMGSTREVKIGYADSFNDNTNRNTFAYPTTLTDPAGFSSNVKYRYDTGANVWAKSPAPQNQTSGKETTREFDSIGRLLKQTLVNTGAYTRYDYTQSDREIHSKVYSTVTDANNNGADAADEVLAESYFDGAGRIRQSRTELPNSAGGWSGQKTEYYLTGQVKRQSVPTEVDSNWNPAGDDQTRGWLWTSREYDWKGRAAREVNTDGTDKLISYDGCGCAGGQVTTIKGENIIESDWQNNNQTTFGRRTQKLYDDLQGRTFKTEALNWDLSVYSTTKTTFNGRDQATLVRQYAGADTSSTFQDSTVVYDGFGRTYKTHKPEQQNADGSPAFTTYNYNGDDSVQSVVDARGASVNYAYNSRGLVEQISSSVPSGSSIPVSPTVSFAFDNIGNRTSMSDGLGSVSYEYNQLSQLTAETRQFSDTLANAPAGGFNLTYDYTLSGQLKSLKDPYGQQFNYAFDKVGRLNSVTGATAFAGVTSYASSPQYRAWGGLKNLTYGNGLQMAQTFDNRLQTASYSLTGASNATMQKNYQYYADGQLKYAQDVLNPVFDRLNTYDYAGRIKEAKSGAEARGETPAAALYRSLPYRQSYSFDAFDNLTQRNNLNWGYSQVSGRRSFNLSYAYQNNRAVGIFNWTYDADGRNVYSSRPDENTNSTYDAAGRLVKINQTEVQVQTDRFFDGDGRETKSTARDTAQTNGEVRVKYYIRSSALGGETLSEADATGRKLKTIVKAAGATLARQTIGYDASGNPTQTVEFEQWDASAMSYRRTLPAVVGTYDGISESGETDPTGTGVGLDGLDYKEENLPPERDYPLYQPRGFDDVAVNQNGSEVVCYENGYARSCATAYRNLENGSSLPKALGTERRPGRRPQFERFETYGWGRISGEYYRDNDGGTKTDPVTGEEIFQVQTDLVEFSFFVPVSWRTRGQTRAGGGGRGPDNRHRLSECLRNLLRSYFPSVNVGGKSYSPVDDSLWNPDGWTFGNAALTNGIFNINYDATKIDTSGGKTIETIAEELEHATQFLNMWASMGKITETYGDRHVREGTRTRDPVYADAQGKWQADYIIESLRAGATTGSPYKDNSFEITAKARSREILNDITIKKLAGCP